MRTADQESQIAEFYAVLGRAISTWQLVETCLSQVYVAAVRPAVPHALMASYHAVQTFTGKLSLTDAAVRYVLRKEEASLTEWANLWGRLKEKSERRNHFAHYSVWTNFLHPVKNKRIILSLQYFDIRLPKGKKAPVDYGANEITQITLRFLALAKETREFAEKVGAASQAQQLKFSLPPTPLSGSDIP